MKETVSGVFFSEHSVYGMYMGTYVTAPMSRCHQQVLSPFQIVCCRHFCCM